MIVVIRVRAAHAGHASECSFDEQERIVMGRGGDCDVQISDASVSLQHASLRRQAGGYILVDERSTNGTFLNGRRLDRGAAQRLTDADRIKLGSALVQVHFLSGHEAEEGRRGVASTQDMALRMLRGEETGSEPWQLRLAVFEGPDRGEELIIEQDGELLVGRAQHCSLVLTDSSVEPEHVRLLHRGGRVWVTAVASSIPTRLDGRPLEHRESRVWLPGAALELGEDRLSLGPVSGELADSLSAASWASGSSASFELKGAVGDTADAWERMPAPPSSSDRAPHRRPPHHLSTSSSSSGPRAPIDALAFGEVEPPRRSSRPAAPQGWSAFDVIIVCTAVLALALSILALAWALAG